MATRGKAAMHSTTMLKEAKDFWVDWGLEVLVAMSCAMHIVLTLFGSRRRFIRTHEFSVKFIIWSTYLLSNFVVTAVFSKLTFTPISDSTKEITDSELRALFAPLLLVQLGSRDSITAYSIQDVRLGQRQFLNLFVQLSGVLWILFSFWTNSAISCLYLPFLLAGLIKYVENAWALSAAIRTSSRITNADFKRGKIATERFFGLPYHIIPDLEMIIRAYFCFFLMIQHHIEKCVYKPLHQSYRELVSIDGYTAEDILKILDWELGFGYDALYTKAPIIYTQMGFALRLISSLSLISGSIVFACLFKDAFVYYINAGFILVVLGVIITLEVYQIYMLFFSDWIILQMSKHCKKPTVMWFLGILAAQSSKWKKWSNTLEQFSLIKYCIYDKTHKHFYSDRILAFQNLDIEIRKYFCTTSVEIDIELKKIVIEWAKKVKEAIKTNNTGGEWALMTLNYGPEVSHKFEWSWTGKDFDKTIIIWHLATEICYHFDSDLIESDPRIRTGRQLSNYVMYLLAVQSHMLSISTTEIVFHYACDKLMSFLKADDSSSITDIKTACRELVARDFYVSPDSHKNEQTMVTHDWNVLSADVKKLSTELLNMNEIPNVSEKWEMICGVWTAMLCIMARNCPADYHAETLRRGGEFATLVWFFLLH